MRKYKQDQRIEVFWIDAEHDPKWQDKESMDKPPKSLCVTLGYYYKHDRDYLYMSMTLGGEVRGDKMTIPLGTIKKVQVVKPA